jgi:membrane fusion protein (multidrug efflux system)
MATDVLNAPEISRDRGTDLRDASDARPRRKFNPWLIAGIVGLLLLAWGVKQYIHGRTHESTDNAQVDGHITPIAPKLPAFVSRVLVEDNAHVNGGDTLVILDDRDVRVRLEQAEADLATARAAAGARGVGQAEAQLSSTRASAAGAQANVVAAEADARKADADLARYRTLASKQVISAQQLDAAVAAAQSAHANLDAAQRQASAGGSNVTAAAANVRAADAKLAAAQTAVDNARLQLSYTVITSPASGVVARRSVEPGELVQVGQQLMAVVPDTGIWVTANLKETQLENVSPGDSAEFSVDAYPGITFHGAVQSLSPATGARFALLPPDNATGNFTKVVQRVPVRIAVIDPAAADHPLRPGMSVEVTITTR